MLTQMQKIQFLGKTIELYQQERCFGVEPSELGSLIYRIGVLYAALILNGQIADDVNIRGYDVVSKNGERVSVKTIGVLNPCFVSFSENTLKHVDRVIILKISDDLKEIEPLINVPLIEANELLRYVDDEIIHNLINDIILAGIAPIREIIILREVNYENWTIKELENGLIEVFCNDILHAPINPILRNIAGLIGLDILNDDGDILNASQLANNIINAITAPVLVPINEVLAPIHEMNFQHWTICQLGQPGPFQIRIANQIIQPVLPELRNMARALRIEIIGENGINLTNNQLGAKIIRLLTANHH